MTDRHISSISTTSLTLGETDTACELNGVLLALPALVAVDAFGKERTVKGLSKVQGMLEDHETVKGMRGDEKIQEKEVDHYAKVRRSLFLSLNNVRLR